MPETPPLRDELEAARPALQTPDGVIPANVEPRDDAEAIASSAAILEWRERAGRRLFAERLGAFERELIMRAFRVGAQTQTRRLDAVIGTGAVTVDGPALRRVTSSYPGLPTDLEANVAAEARRLAEHAHEPPAALRLYDVRQVLRELEDRLRAFHVAEDEGEAEDAGAELELVDRLRRTIEDLELGLGKLNAAADGTLEETPDA